MVAIKEGKQAPIPAKQILINEAIIDGVLRSSEQGCEVEVNIPDLSLSSL